MLNTTQQNTLDSRGRPIVELPPKTVEIVRLELSPEEREFYEALKKRSKVYTTHHLMFLVVFGWLRDLDAFNC